MTRRKFGAMRIVEVKQTRACARENRRRLISGKGRGRMASGCRSYLRSSAYKTQDGGRRPAVLGWEEVVGGSARRRLPVATTTQSVRSIQQGKGGFEVGA